MAISLVNYMKKYILFLLLSTCLQAEIVSKGTGVVIIGGQVIPINSSPQTWRATLGIPDTEAKYGLLLTSSNIISLDTNLYPQVVTSDATNHVLNVTNLVNLLQVTNDVNFLHATNLCAGAQGQLLMRGDSTNRLLSFNASWKFLGAAAPTSLASNKVANLYWIVLGTDQTNVICGYAVQP